jgi:hypothetical protein
MAVRRLFQREMMAVLSPVPNVSSPAGLLSLLLTRRSGANHRVWRPTKCSTRKNAFWARWRNVSDRGALRSVTGGRSTSRQTRPSYVINGWLFNKARIHTVVIQ